MAASSDSTHVGPSSPSHSEKHPPVGDPVPPPSNITNEHATKPSRWSHKTRVADPKAGAVGGGDAAVAIDAATSGSAAIDVEGKAKDEVKAVGFTQMFRYHTKGEIILNFVGLVAAIASGAAQPLMTLIFGKLTNSFVSFAAGLDGYDASNPASVQALRAAQDELRRVAALDALYLTVIGIGMFLTVYIYMGIWVYTGEKASKRLRENYLRSVLRQDPAYFDTLGAGEVATRIQTDTDLVQSGISEKVAIAVSYVATFVTGFVLAYARSWRLALAMSSILPCIMVTGAFMGKFGTKYKSLSLQYIAESGSLAEEVISTIRIAQSFGTQSRLARKFDALVDRSLGVGIKNAIVSGVGLGCMFFVIYASYGLAFVYGVILINQKRADAGIVVNVFMSILIGSFSLAMLAPELQSITNARGAAAKLYQTMDRIPTIDSLSEEGLKPAQCIGHIEFQSVLFHYPSRPGVPILQGNGLSVAFPAGKTAALVGSSGSGKSTVIALVERWYDPIAGRVLLDGVNVRELNVNWLRQQIGLVSQEPVLFATTVRGNVEYGLIGTPHEHASDEVKLALVKEACIKANAHGFIEGLTEGYNTMVGESGMLLSGGQKQRVAIARAIVSDPKILLLDEATSALDTLSEGIVQDALDKASAGRTTITIAHRLSTIKDCNMILVMGQGQVLEKGTHNELLANPDGAYAALVSAQKLATQDDSNTLANNSSDEELDDPEKKILTPHEAEEYAANEKPKILTRTSTTGGASMSSEALKEGMKGESERAPVLGYPTIFKRMAIINQSEKKYYILGIIASCCSGMVYPAFGILYGQALTNFSLPSAAERQHESFRSGLWYFIMAILAAIAILIQNYSLVHAAETLTVRLRSLTFRAILRSDIAWFDEDKNSTGALTSSLADRPQKISGLAGVTLGTIIQSIATIIGGSIIGLVYGWKLSLIGIACIPFIIFAGYIRLRLVVMKDQSNKAAHEHSSNLACEAAGAIRTVASLTREADALRIYSESLNGPLLKAKKTLIYSNALYALSQAMSLWVIALVFYVGSRWIADLSYTINSFFVVLMSVTFGAIQAGNVFSFVPDISQAQSAASGILHLLDSQPEIDAESTDGKMVARDSVQGHLRFENVHFRYPTRPGVRVLRNLNLDVRPGEFVALVGGSGCGKSTTIQLASRFYDPLAGTVSLDGIPLTELNVSSFRSCISLVSQEPTLYSGSIRENICLGAIKPASEVTQDELETACRSANILEFVSSLPDGFETQVGGKGAQLSGGQKQRIAIARALIRNPKILLLDEATSALDSTSEKVVQAALDNAAKGRTTISIAHRLSTIQHADRIYFFKDGKIAEAGTHQELIALRGGYAELCQLQSLSRT